jgi:hypothetical protein
MNRLLLAGSRRLADDERSVHAQQFSAIVRSVALSEIAVAWLFSGGLSKTNASPETTLHLLRNNGALELTLFSSIAALFLDALQYLGSALVWSTYSWAINQIELNDADPEAVKRGEITPSARLGWRLARAYGLMGRLEEVNEPTAEKRYKGRRDALRSRIAAAGEADATDPDDDDSWAPAWINLPALLCFLCKAVALATASVSLLKFLISHS